MPSDPIPHREALTATAALLHALAEVDMHGQASTVAYAAGYSLRDATPEWEREAWADLCTSLADALGRATAVRLMSSGARPRARASS